MPRYRLNATAKATTKAKSSDKPTPKKKSVKGGSGKKRKAKSGKGKGDPIAERIVLILLVAVFFGLGWILWPFLFADTRHHRDAARQMREITQDNPDAEVLHPAGGHAR